MLDLIIIGAGPAGVQAGYFLKKMGFSFEILERNNCPGSFFKKYPRHGTLISINKRYTGQDNPEYNLRHDWNSLLSTDGPKFTEFDEAIFPQAESLVRYMDAFVDHAELEISYNQSVTKIAKVNGVFEITTDTDRVLKAKNILIATGFCKQNVPDVEGIEHAELYSDFSIDKKDFNNKRVLIIGKANSAFETADHLADSAAVVHITSPSSLRLAWNTHYVGDLRAFNNNILDMYQLKSQHAIMDADILKIKPHNDGVMVTLKYKHAGGESETLYYDKLLCCAGFKFSADIFDESCRPALCYNDKFPALTNGFESKNVEGLYFAGTITHSLDYRQGTSGFIHGFRYNIKAFSEILNYRLKGKNIPSQKVSNTPNELGKHIIDRSNVVSSLWQQPKFLAEFYHIFEDKAEHYQALPLAYGIEDHFSCGKVIALTFEYGEMQQGDIFSQTRIARDDVKQADQSLFLHPVIRYYENGELKQEFHVIEDLEGNWTYDEHLAGIEGFLEKVLQVEAELIY